MAQEEEELFKKQIADFDSLIKELASSTDLSATAEAQRLAAEQARTREKLRAAEERSKNLIEEAKRKQADALADAERSDEKKRKRDELARQAEAKSQQVRQTIMESNSLLSQVNVIEAKKKVLVEIRNNTEYDVAESNAELSGQMNERIREIEEKPYRKGELSNGVPTENAKRLRNEEIDAIRTEYQTKMASEETKIRGSTERQENALYNEIHSDYATISKKRTVTSVENDLRYSFGAYDANTASWPVTLYIYSDGISLVQQHFDLTYSSLTGMVNIPTGGKAYEDYLDDVDLWDSWFSRGDPVLTFEVDYFAEAMPDDYPSEYKIDFTAIRVIDTISGRLYCHPWISAASINLRLSPVYDIRDQKKIEEDRVNRQVAEEQERLAEGAKQRTDEAMQRAEAQRAAETQRTTGPQKAAKTGSFPDIGLYALAGMGVRDYDICFDVGLHVPFGFLFTNLSFGMIKTPQSIDPIIKDKMMMKGELALGLSIDTGFNRLYLMGSAGIVSGKTDGYWMKPSKNGESKPSNTAQYLSYGFSVSMEVPLVNHITALLQVDYYNILDALKAYLDVKAGVALHLGK